MNAMDWGQSKRAFAGSIFSLLDRVEYRRITIDADLEDVASLRQQAYTAREFIDSENFGSFVDEYDRMEDCYVIGVYIDEKLTSTVRLHIVSADHLHGPTFTYFPHRARELTSLGRRYVDPSRFAADQQLMWQYPMLPFLTLRVVAMACEYFRAEHATNFIRSDVASFYTRSFGSQELEPPQMVRGFTVPMMLTAARVEDIKQRLELRYPFFRSLPSEKRLMFAPESGLGYMPLTILPTAKLASGKADSRLGVSSFFT
jgi:hypothetical protein